MVVLIAQFNVLGSILNSIELNIGLVQGLQQTSFTNARKVNVRGLTMGFNMSSTTCRHQVHNHFWVLTSGVFMMGHQHG